MKLELELKLILFFFGMTNGLVADEIVNDPRESFILKVFRDIGWSHLLQNYFWLQKAFLLSY